MTVLPEDRAKWERQVAALQEFENDDEGTPEWRAMMVASVDRRRAEHGHPPLREWWEDKTEHRLHERARALGLLRRVR